MAKRPTKAPKAETLVPNVDYSKLSDEQLQDLLEQTFETLIVKLEESGCDPDFITGVLFNQFTARLAEINDREQYELILETALETPWEEQTIH